MQMPDALVILITVILLCVWGKCAHAFVKWSEKRRHPNATYLSSKELTAKLAADGYARCVNGVIKPLCKGMWSDDYEKMMEAVYKCKSKHGRIVIVESYVL